MSRPIKPQLRLKAYRDYLQSRRTGTDAYYLRVHLQSTRIDTEEVASHVASRLNIEPAQAWKSHATLTLLAKQDCPLWLQYD